MKQAKESLLLVISMNAEFLDEKVKQVNQICASFRPVSECLLAKSLYGLTSTVSMISAATSPETPPDKPSA